MLIFLLVSLALFTGAPARAECQCLWQGSFSDVQAGTDLVLAGTVIQTRGNSIDLDVTRVLRGDAAGDVVRVWLKAGDYCRPPVSGFPLGSSWVVALDKITEDVPGGFNPHTPNISYGRIGDYSLSNCGGYWLSLAGDRVTGNLVDAPRWDYTPDMSPVLLELVAGFVAGENSREALLEASRKDPKLRELMLDTRAFLRTEN